MDFGNVKLCTSFMSEEEEKRLIETANQKAKEVEGADPAKVYNVLYAYMMMRYVTRGSDKVNVSVNLFEPYKGSGSVHVIAKRLCVSDTGMFMVAAGLADNLDICPKTDGTVWLSLGFNGLIKK